MTARRAALLLAAALALGATLPAAGGRGLLAAAGAEEPWRTEFDDVCGKTQDAMTLGTEELRSLVARCDKLKPAVAALEPSLRKVFSRRLQQCRDLYQFVLDSRSR